MRRAEELDYRISTHEGLPGARLSLTCHFVNEPHPTVDAALAAAIEHAGNRPHTVKRERYSAPRYRKGPHE